MSSSTTSRRRFLLRSAVAVGAAPLALRLLAAPAQAADLPPLPADNPTAVALGYTEDAASCKHASYQAGRQCAGCQFFSAAADAARGPCSLFPGFSVAGKGWCSAWAVKA